MTLKKLSDQNLISETVSLVKQEREVLTSVLHHLAEIERRKLFSDYGYCSLFEFAVKRLGYSEDQAYRRIAAMRLLREIPEMEPSVTDGSLSLSNIAAAHAFFRREKKFSAVDYSREQKISIFHQIENKTAREAEKIILGHATSPLTFSSDKQRTVTPDFVEIKFTVPNEVFRKIEIIKGFLAHKYPNISMMNVMESLCDLGLKKWSLYSPATSQKRRVNVSGHPVKKSEVRWEVWRKADGRCENCNSRFALEIDHILPRAKGGGDHIENLRLLCRPCNQRAAIKEFGLKKMEVYISGGK